MNLNKKIIDKYKMQNHNEFESIRVDMENSDNIRNDCLDFSNEINSILMDMNIENKKKYLHEYITDINDRIDFYVKEREKCINNKRSITSIYNFDRIISTHYIKLNYFRGYLHSII
jgi:hypothetical protein